MAALFRRRKLEADDACNAQDDSKESRNLAGLIEKKESKEGRADGADAGPHGIARADGYCAQSQGQKIQAYHHSNNREGTRAKFGEARAVFQPDRPCGFKYSGDK